MVDLVEVVSYHVDIKKNPADFMPVEKVYTERPMPPGRSSVSKGSRCRN